jgi:hypothetical protein
MKNTKKKKHSFFFVDLWDIDIGQIINNKIKNIKL